MLRRAGGSGGGGGGGGKGVGAGFGRVVKRSTVYLLFILFGHLANT